MRDFPRIYPLIPAATLFLSGLAVAGTKVDFNREVRPILSDKCFHCHGPDENTREAKLRLDTRKGALKMDAIVPGDPDDSEVIYRITSDDEDEIMPPPDSHLSLDEKEIAILRQWIAEGAEYKGHWSFSPPASSAEGPISAIIDSGIGERLAEAGLGPSADASRETLIRRLSLDLRGIPPTLEEIDAFLADTSPNAWEALVDRMLDSPQCAERLALDWLDVARYSDTNGYSIDDHRDMWGWRDWLIHSFMENKPFDEFIVEQLAGDLLADATPMQRIATGFLRNSMNTHEGGTIPEEYRVAYIADKIDTVSTTFMGLTMKCAQCHDHKYDPISQEDYYRFYAFFNSATEKGMGATNGNTAPFLEVTSPLHETARVEQSIRERADRIRQLRSDLKDPAEFEAWKSAILAKSGPAPRIAAGFILPDKDPEAEWIWADKTGETKRILLRHEAIVSKPLKAARLAFTCDDSAEVFINGERVGAVESWMKPVVLDVGAKLKQGRNPIGVDARNAGSLAGFIAWLQLDFEDGTRSYVTSSREWRWKPIQSDTPTEALASDGGWKEPVSLGKYGVQPWKKLEMGGGAPGQDKLATVLRKEPGSWTREEQALVDDAFLKQAKGMTRKLGKSMKIELGILEKQLKQSQTTTVMIMDAPGDRKTHMLMRGEYDKPGKEVTAGIPEMFDPLPGDQPADRLALARWLVADDHPLTARVIVNRYWQLIFGTGLVRTAEDFGSQGEWPSHPELLDNLAVHFREGGWNLRRLLKGIVMSDTYQRQSDISPEMLEKDPANRLLARAPRIRLQAELVRDNALAISDLLNPQVGGPSVYPKQPDGLWRQVSHFGYGAFTAQSYYPDQGEQTRRRSMYSFWKRTAPPPSMAIFDAPTRETCTVRRMATNTPLQALVLLNDPQYLDASRALAGRMIDEGGESLEERISYAFRLATARTPMDAELKILVDAHGRELARFNDDPKAAAELLEVAETSPDTNGKAALMMVASTILNLNETITRQ